MKHLLLLIICLITLSLHSCSQPHQPKSTDKKVGGGCEGCEAVYESPIPFNQLNHIDTLPDFFEQGSKLVVSGIVYKADGRTPAQNVVLYVYHTDQKGFYSKGSGKEGLRHGYIRGWVRTNAKGEYKILTLIPASYPNSTIEKHIHPIIKEEGFTEYYIDDFTFDDDKYLTSARRKAMELRGGNGVLVTEKKGDLYYAERNIYLGRNIPGYPQIKTGLQSGLELGDNCPAFEPIHLSGADKGSDACPMCKYGYGQGVMVWFNHTSIEKLNDFAQQLEKEMLVRGEKQLRVFLIYMNPMYKENDAPSLAVLRKKLMQWCEEQQLRKVALLWTASPVDENCKLYKLNPKAMNTVFVYQKRKVVEKWINTDYTREDVKNILNILSLPNIQLSYHEANFSNLLLSAF
jgi:protocatechuate 3,4-dioxygenase, beta subunit